jgi:membrane-associated protein
MNILLTLIEQYRYLILFPMAAVEGPVVGLIAGFLVHMGYLSFIPTFLLLVLGDLIPDTIYYYIGRLGKNKNLLEKYSKKSDFISLNTDILKKLWNEHGQKTMFFSKLAYGLATPFLISAGLVGMPLGTFLSYSVPVTLIQYGIIITAGYFLGQSYQVAVKYIKYGGFLVAGVVILFIIGYIFAFRYAKKQIKTLEEKDGEAK